MRIDTPRDLRVREVRIINVSGEKIPPRSFAKVTDVDILGYLEIDKPDADGISPTLLVVTGGTELPIDASGTAFSAGSGKLYVDIDLAGAVPVNGDNFGTKSGEWWGEKGQSGFKALGEIGGSVCINPQQSGDPLLYKATSNAAGSTVNVRAVESDGVTLVGDEITVSVVT